MRVRTVTLLVMLAGLMLPGSIAIAQSSPEIPETPVLPESSDDPALLRALVEYFAGVSRPGDELIVGELPESLSPGLFPMPSDTRILGSVVRGDGNAQGEVTSEQPPYAQVMLTSELAPEAIQAFYEEQLLSAGWQTNQARPFAWVFRQGDTAQQPDPAEFLHSNFCSSADDVLLRIQALELQPDQSTVVRLDISPNAANAIEAACSDIVLPALPTLHLPNDVEIFSYSTGGGDGSLHTEANIVASTTPEALLSHLAEQFDQAGWIPTERGDDAVQSWGSWTVESEQGETWQSMLSVVQVPGDSGTYVLRARAERQADE